MSFASNSALDLVEKPSRVSAAATQNNAPINFSGTYPDGTALPAGTHASAYAGAQLAASGGYGSGYVYSVVGGLPPGLALSSAGDLTGTPLYAGSWMLVVQVVDTAGNAVSGSFPITVA